MSQQDSRRSFLFLFEDLLAVSALLYTSFQYFSGGNPPIDLPLGTDLTPLHEALSGTPAQWTSLAAWWYALLDQFTYHAYRLPGMSAQALHTSLITTSYFLFRLSGARSSLSLFFSAGLFFSPIFFEHSPDLLLSSLILLLTTLAALQMKDSISMLSLFTCGIFLASYGSSDLSFLYWFLLCSSLLHLLMKFFGENTLDTRHLRLILLCVFFASGLISFWGNPTQSALYLQRGTLSFVETFAPYLNETAQAEIRESSATVLHMTLQHPDATIAYFKANLITFFQNLLRAPSIDFSYLHNALLTQISLALSLGLYAIFFIFALLFSPPPQTSQERTRSSFLISCAILFVLFEGFLGLVFGTALPRLVLPCLLFLAYLSSSLERLTGNRLKKSSLLITLFLCTLLPSLSPTYGKGFCPTFLSSCLYQTTLPPQTPVKDLYETLRKYRFPKSYTLLSPYKGDEIYLQSTVTPKGIYKEFVYAAQANKAADYLEEKEIDVVLVNHKLEAELQKDGSMKRYLDPKETRSKFQYIILEDSTVNILAQRKFFVTSNEIPDPTQEEELH